ncbi:MAG: 4Fe-4S binding protein [Bacteroidetes bacterium]|nr:4Fe-4S binding protein [Bacteroidota bacterium]
MRKQQISKDILRIFSEIVFLVLVVILLLNGKLQFWLGIFVIGIIVSFFMGRFFCGWICPMGTLFRPIGLIYNKLGIRRMNTPEFMKSPWVRIIVLFLFAGVMILTRIFHIKVNFLLIMIIISVAITLFFSEDMWHHHLCPFGTILSISSRVSGRGIIIDEDACIACGKCQKVCPSQSILTLETKKRANKLNECLMCYKCQDVCPVNACTYRKKL